MFTAVIPTTSSQSAAHAAVQPPATPAIATFEGRKINLQSDWEAATACHIDAEGDAACFRDEHEMDTYIEQIEATASRATNCSSSARLYANTSHGGAVVSFSQRSTWINLSAYGFDNVTSSYRIGNCSAVFKASSFGGGGTYPGSTAAGASSTSMSSGWDNVVSSIWIN